MLSWLGAFWTKIREWTTEEVRLEVATGYLPYGYILHWQLVVGHCKYDLSLKLPHEVIDPD